MDESQNSLSPSALPEKKKKLLTKTSSRDDDLSAKADLWRMLTNQMTHGASNTNNFPKQDGFTLEDKARRFGQPIADSLLECDPRDWSRVKKIMDLFWENEEAKNNQQSLSVYRSSNLLQHSQLQEPSYKELPRNSSFTNASNFDIHTLEK